MPKAGEERSHERIFRVFDRVMGQTGRGSTGMGFARVGGSGFGCWRLAEEGAGHRVWAAKGGGRGGRRSGGVRDRRVTVMIHDNGVFRRCSMKMALKQIIHEDEAFQSQMTYERGALHLK
ncbi:hypothetical protein HAX54_042159 [Datura stramonium]|uniref:Uncharacterized protein n=1 Tax=Datura stramonium TaxID=4076 RepID=A0ABS8SMA4_DATST|nr:hypothetical protein [Datura stramonium]